MTEDESNEVGISQTKRKKQNAKVGVNVNYRSLWEEIKNARAFFNWNDFAAGVVFELVPSAWDLGSDFNLAAEWSRDTNITSAEWSRDRNLTWAEWSRDGNITSAEWSRDGNITSAEWSRDGKLSWAAALTYFLLSIPGVVMAVKTLYNRVLRRCCTCSFTDHCFCKFIGYIILMALILMALMGAGFMYDNVTMSGIDSPGGWVLFTTAILTSILILSTKLLRVIIHGPQMKKLSVKMSAVESQNESTFQLALISVLIIIGDAELGNSTIMGISSSLVMIAKSGAENLLTFGTTNKLEDKGFLEKWKLLLSLTPVLTMTCFFRVMSVALWGMMTLYGTAALPGVVLLLLKTCLPSLSSLTPLDIAQGVVGEISIPSIWGTIGREKSRNLQLGLAICHLFVNTGFLIIAIIWNPVMWFAPDIIINAVIFRPVAITALVCGWISFPLHLYQIYWVESWDKLKVLATL